MEIENNTICLLEMYIKLDTWKHIYYVIIKNAAVDRENSEWSEHGNKMDNDFDRLL